MANRMSNDFQFIDVGRQDPQKKDARTRAREFAEIYEPFKPQEAASQGLPGPGARSRQGASRGKVAGGPEGRKGLSTACAVEPGQDR